EPRRQDRGHDLRAGRLGLAVAALPDGRPPVPPPAPRARAEARGRPAVRERLSTALAPGPRAARQAARPEPADGLPRDRLLAPRPVALHLEALLGGRRARCSAIDRMAGQAARRDRRPRERDAGAVARLVPPALARDLEGAGRDARRSDPVRV